MWSIPGDVATLATQGRLITRAFFRVQLSGTWQRFWKGEYDVSWGGFTYTAVPVLEDPSYASQAGDLAVRTCSVRLPGPGTLLDNIYGQLILNSPMEAGLLFLGADYVPTWEKVLFRGRIEDFSLPEQQGTLSVLTVEGATRVADARANSGRMRSNADQRVRDSNDGFLKNVTVAADRQITIGKQPSRPAGGVGGGVYGGTGGLEGFDPYNDMVRGGITF